MSILACRVVGLIVSIAELGNPAGDRMDNRIVNILDEDCNWHFVRELHRCTDMATTRVVNDANKQHRMHQQ
jgi:hypothetical protein